MTCNHKCGKCGEHFEVAQKAFALAPSPATEFVDMTFPVIGLGGKEWGLTGRQTDEWREAFPGIDVLAECRKARVWLVANGLKTAGGMPRFLVSWLGKAADGRTGAKATSTPVKVDPYCSWHHTPGSANKPSNRPSPGCPTCKDLRARAVLRSGDVESVGDVLKRMLDS